MIGDERICSRGKHGTSVKDLTKIIDTVRKSFPDRKKAVIYYNECGGTFGEGDDCKDPAMKDVPEGLDWISVDIYRGRSKTSSDYVDGVKHYYNKCLYPKMHSHQGVFVT